MKLAKRAVRSSGKRVNVALLHPMSYKDQNFHKCNLAIFSWCSQSTGIAFMTSLISARQRWAESHFLRTTIISYLNENLNLNKKGRHYRKSESLKYKQR